MLASLLGSFTSQVFVLALPGGVAALAVGTACALVWRHHSDRPVPIAGVLLALAVAIGLSRVPELLSSVAREKAPLWDLPVGLVAGLVILASGVSIGERLSAPALAVVLAIPGAWIVAADAALPDISWIRILTVTTILVGGSLLLEFDRRWRDSALAVPLIVVSAAGIYAAVPETTQAAVLLASAAPLVFLGWPRPMASLGAAGAFAVAGLFAWTAAAGGYARPPSIVGGLGCFGLLAVEPLARALDPAGARALDVLPAKLRLVGAIAGQLVIAFICARVAARSSSIGQATTMTIAANLAAAAILVGGLRIARRSRVFWDSSRSAAEKG